MWHTGSGLQFQTRVCFLQTSGSTECVCDGVSPSLRPPSSRRFPFGIGEEPNLHQNDHHTSVLLQQHRPGDNLGCSHHRGREEVLAVLDIIVLGKKQLQLKVLLQPGSDQPVRETLPGPPAPVNRPLRSGGSDSTSLLLLLLR